MKKTLIFFSFFILIKITNVLGQMPEKQSAYIYDDYFEEYELTLEGARLYYEAFVGKTYGHLGVYFRPKTVHEMSLYEIHHENINFNYEIVIKNKDVFKAILYDGWFSLLSQDKKTFVFGEPVKKDSLVYLGTQGYNVLMRREAGNESFDNLIERSAGFYIATQISGHYVPHAHEVTWGSNLFSILVSNRKITMKEIISCRQKNNLRNLFEIILEKKLSNKDLIEAVSIFMLVKNNKKYPEREVYEKLLDLR